MQAEQMIIHRIIPHFSPKGWTACLFTVVCMLMLVPQKPASAADMSGNGPERQVVSLPTLEAQYAAPGEVLIALADLEAATAALKEQQNEQGLKLFAAANAGTTTDTSLAEAERRYTTYDIRAGLRYPILGRAAIEQGGVAEAATAVKEKEQHLRLARVQGFSLLRRSYLDYWASQEKLKLGQGFLASEAQQSALLAKRRQAGLLLEADYLEFLSAYDLARRNQAHFRASSLSSLHVLQRLSQAPTDFAATAPELPPPCLDQEQLQTIVLNGYPSINVLQARLAGLEQQAELADTSQLKAHVDFYSAAGNDDSRNAPEYTIGAGIAVELPAGSLVNRERPARVAAQARVQRARHELALEKATLWKQAQEALALFEASSQDLTLATRRLRAAEEAVRERWLRTAMEGDSLEKLQQSRYGYYQVAIEALDAQVRRWQHQITLLEYAPRQPEDSQHASPAYQPLAIDAALLNKPLPPDLNDQINQATAASKPALRGLYVWNSQQFISKTSDLGYIDQLKSAGFRRIFLSLNRAQLSAQKNKPAREHLARWLERMRSQGMEVSLLLGEPLWILPKHRPALLAIIASLKHLPFAGLHLDIEPDQLTPQAKRNVDITKAWLATVAAATKKSPWPVGVSMHPRYYNAQDGWPRLGSSLVRIGVAEVSLMIYNTHIDKVTAIASPILHANPDLRFSVAQSVEPILTVAESHAGTTQPAFSQVMTSLTAQLRQPNFAGIVVQDWQSWGEMKP